MERHESRAKKPIIRETFDLLNDGKDNDILTESFQLIAKTVKEVSSVN